MLIALAAVTVLILSNNTANIISGYVTKVVDGDTLYISGEPTRIRLFGVDAPETHEPGYTDSTHYLRTITTDRFLTCRVSGRDRYNRHIARCFADDIEINREMLREPHTKEYCRYSDNVYGTCQ